MTNLIFVVTFREGRRRQHVRVMHHQPVRRGVVLVQPDAVEAPALELLPGFEVLDVGARRHLRIEMRLGQRIRKPFARRLELIEMLAVRKQVHDVHFHGSLPAAEAAPYQSAISPAVMKTVPGLAAM